MNNKNNYSVTPFWDKSVMDNKTKQSRVMLTINLNRKQFRITLKLRCTKAEFDAALSSRSATSKELRKDIQEHVDKAEKILNLIPSIDKNKFTKLFKSEFNLSHSDKTSIKPIYDIRFDELMGEKRFGTAHALKAAFNALLKYKLKLKGVVVKSATTKIIDLPPVDLFFEDIDASFLKAFRSHLIDIGRSETTTGLYLGHLRAFYNHVMEQGIIPHKDDKSHPFYKVKISNNVRTKAVLYPEQIKKLWEHQPNGIREERAIAYWFLCYLLNGMNFKDLCYLKRKNVKGDILTFVRQKTKDSSSSTKEIQMYLHDEAKRLITKYGNDSQNPDDYIFPLLSNCHNYKHMEETKLRHQRVFNKKLSPIGKILGFDVHLCLNLARHSFATALKLNKTPTSFISDAMGHTSSKTTEHYMKSLPTEHLRELSNSLMKF